VRNEGDITRQAIMLLRFAMIGKGSEDFGLHGISLWSHAKTL
jgi:hypothetical protein